MSWGAMVWRTKRYGSWPGFNVEALQDGTDVDDQALGDDGRGGVYSCRAFFLFLIVVLRVTSDKSAMSDALCPNLQRKLARNAHSLPHIH